MADVRSSSGYPRRRDWLTTRERRMAGPSWLGSLLLHGLLLFIVSQIAARQPLRPDVAGEGGEGFREVGIYTGDPGGSDNGEDTDAAPAPAETSPSVSESVPASESRPPLVDDSPPIPLNLPAKSGPSVIGSSGVSSESLGRPQVGSQFGEKLLKPVTGQGTGRPGAGGGTGTGIGKGTGRTALFGVGDGGKRFVYVIDRSGSMADYDAFHAAKSELTASIEHLDETQQFQIIFYNNRPLMLSVRNQRFPMFYGTDAQRLQVFEQLRAIEPSDGTNHLPAIAQALDLAPDVIFFLTDGTEPEMSAADLAEVRQRNRSGAHIHCIEFGDGPASKVQRTGNFLVKLAEQNHGQYAYRNVRQLLPK